MRSARCGAFSRGDDQGAQQRDENHAEEDDDESATLMAHLRGGHRDRLRPFISMTMIAFCTWSRFSASSRMADCLESMTSAATSSPRWAGRQCMKIACLRASDMTR